MTDSPGTAAAVALAAPGRWRAAAWALLAAGGLVLPAVAVLRSPADPARWGEALFVLGWIAVGAVLVRHGGDRTIALCAAAFLVVFPVMFTDVASTVLPGAPVVDGALEAAGTAAFLLFGYLFPDGRFVPGWTRWLWLAWALYLLADKVVLRPGTGGPTVPPAVADTAWVLAILSVVVVQVYRYQHVSSRPEQEQTKWMVYGIAVSATGSLAVIALADLGVFGQGAQAERVITPAAYLFVSVIPVALAAAVLRYRLWDVDLLINRTLVYVLLTVAALTFYVVVVLGLGLLVGRAGWLPASALTVGLLAVVLQPLHAVARRAVNHAMYGRRDDPYTVLVGLGQRLQSVPEGASVLQTIVDGAAAALRLPYVAIELVEPPGVVAVAGEAPGSPVRWPLEHQGRLVGFLVAGPRRGEAFGGADTRLLADLAGHAGAAVHAVVLGRALEQARAHLVVAREEERRRLHRDLHDELGATLSALTLKAGATRVLMATDPAAAAATAGEMEAELQSAVSDVRRLVYGLRPPILDERGLRAAVEDHLAQTRGGPAVDVLVDPDRPWPDLPAAVELAAYRIAQEALTNVVRHSGARHCTLGLRLAGDGNGRSSVTVEIVDDGVGLGGSARPGVGLTSMRERAEELGGRCSVESGPDGGVRVVAVLPVAPGGPR